MKVILFGDSMLARFGKERLQKLESMVPEGDFYNCATGGWDSNDCAMKAPYIASLKPDAVVISVGTNDASPWKQVPLEIFRNNLLNIRDSFKDSKVIFFPPPPVNEDKQAGELIRSNELMQQYSSAVKDVSSSAAVACIDSWAIFSSLLEQGQDYHVEDGVHLNDNGNDLLTDQLAEALSSK
ncbi:MAG: GDSL-type esterase/lipase family protein [Patescibacteria group bacterium]